jgi:hypothetical protein
MLISNRANIAAGGINTNIFLGSYIEFMPDDGVLQFGFTTDAGTATPEDVKADILCGTELIASSYVPPSFAAITPPIYPDHFHLSCGAPAGVRIIGKVTNANAAARNLMWSVMFDRL